jgi:hypothetical protein
MKKLFFLMSMLFILSTDTFAKPIKWHLSGTLEIGRPKKNCLGLWVCISDVDWEVKLSERQTGNPTTNEHGIGVGVDGNLYLIINERLLASKQADKLSLLKNKSSYYMEADEIIPQSFLSSLNYSKSNIIKAGNKEISFENGYYFVKLN